VLDERGEIVWRGLVDTHPPTGSGPAAMARRVRQGWSGKQVYVATAGSGAQHAGFFRWCAWMPNVQRMRSRADGEIRQGGRLFVGEDAEDGLVQCGAREVLRDHRFRYGGEHGRSPKNRLPMSHRKSDLGILSRYTWLNPSTRPSLYERGKAVAWNQGAVA
jgi:hypothetical protein